MERKNPKQGKIGTIISQIFSNIQQTSMENSTKPKQTKIPLVALIGLPNSGKSTLINRICGFRKAITANEAGTTRDLTFGEDVWENMYFRLVDTGGITINPDGPIAKLTQIKTLTAIAESDLLIWVIDRKQNPDTISLEIIQKIWKLGKPFIVGINKVDSPNAEKDISEYAKLGGVGFVNFSAASGYGIGELLDLMVENLEKSGFEKKMEIIIEEDDITKIERKKGKLAIQKSQIVRQNKDGSYYVVRENTDKGPGLFQSMTKEMIQGWEEKHKKVEIENLVFDFYQVLFDQDVEGFVNHIVEISPRNEDFGQEIETLIQDKFAGVINWDEFWQELQKTSQIPDLSWDKWDDWTVVLDETADFIKAQKTLGKKIYYLSNILPQNYKRRKMEEIYGYFDGGIASCEAGCKKPSTEIFDKLIYKYQLDPAKTVFVDDSEKNVKTARDLGFWAIEYLHGWTDLEEELERIENAKIERIPPIPKVLFLGKPNVGKSSLFNALAGEDIQIVTDIAGTTLSVNDTLIERTDWVKPKEKVVKKDEEIDLDEDEEIDDFDGDFEDGEDGEDGEFEVEDYELDETEEVSAKKIDENTDIIK